MSDTPEYILKKPVYASYYEEGQMAVEFEEISECLIISDEQFENTFVPLDRQALTEQVAIITEKVFTYGCMAGRGDALSTKQESYVDDAGWVDELLALFGLENKEQNNE